MAISTIDINADYAVDLINAHDNIQESAQRSSDATNAVAARVAAYVSTLGQPTTTASNFLGTTNGYRIDASKIAGGGVSNADFQKLDYTDPIQPALDTVFDYIHSWIDGDNLVRAIKPVAIADGSINYAEIQAIRDIQDNIQESITGMRSRLDSVASGGGIITVEEIGDKNVSDDELGYLNGAGSDIQAQIDTHESRLTSLGELSSGNVKIDVANIGAGTTTNAHVAYLSGYEGDVQASMDGLFSTLSSVSIGGGSADKSNTTVSIPPSSIAGGSISAAEINRLTGISSSIQSTITSKRNRIGTLGSIANNTIKINALRIGNRTVSNGEFGFLRSLSGNAQTQLTDLITWISNITQSLSGNTVTVSPSVIADRRTANNVSDTELTYANTLTSSGQTQLDAIDNKLTSLGTVAADHTVSINASVIGNKDVSNAEWQTLNGLTGNIQTQLNGKMDGENLIASITRASNGEVTVNWRPSTGVAYRDKIVSNL